jgi:Lar family restriction alleviation protein
MTLTMSNEIKLLPCPFCGGKAAITLGLRRGGGQTVDVICQDCSGAMLAFCEDDAIADWNTRVPSAGSTGKEP